MFLLARFLIRKIHANSSGLSTAVQFGVPVGQVRVPTFSSSAARDWETFCKFAEGCMSVRAPCGIFASFAATLARCDSSKCLRCRFSDTTNAVAIRRASVGQRARRLGAGGAHRPRPDERLPIGKRCSQEHRRADQDRRIPVAAMHHCPMPVRWCLACPRGGE